MPGMSPRWLIAAAMAIPLFAATAAHAKNGGFDKTLVDTEYGTIDGSVDHNTKTLSWKGIPYARPPVGALRWSAPADPDKWSTVRETKLFGNACSQYGRIYGPGANNRYDTSIADTLLKAVGKEDCLYLNVWRPANAGKKLPVIVFFHGGSNVSGYTADPMYDGATLAQRANAVVVTVNFRLGILGFLNLAQLKTGDDADTASGNFAILDSIKSLQFLNRNVASFGGDPDNVTIMGESAGAINVYALLTSPKLTQGKKLFHRAVPLSGGLSLAINLPQGTIPTMSPATVYEAQGLQLLYQLLIVDNKAHDLASAQAYAAGQTTPQIADYLRSKTPAELFYAILFKLAPLGLGGSGPIPEGAVVAANPVGAIQSGDYVQVPVLAGNTRDEGKLFPSFLPFVGGSGNARIVTDAELFMNHFNYKPNDPPQTAIEQWIAASYLPAATPVTGFTARAETFNRVFFLASRDNILNALKAKQPDVWYYRFDWDEQPAPWNTIYGAAHLFDLPFVFGNFGPSLMANIMNTTANQPGRLALSDAMMRSLGAFARRGDPNNDALGVYWPTWPTGLLFDATQTQKQIGVQVIEPAIK